MIQLIATPWPIQTVAEHRDYSSNLTVKENVFRDLFVYRGQPDFIPRFISIIMASLANITIHVQKSRCLCWYI
jgi:hypothetical protein